MSSFCQRYTDLSSAEGFRLIKEWEKTVRGRELTRRHAKGIEIHQVILKVPDPMQSLTEMAAAAANEDPNGFGYWVRRIKEALTKNVDYMIEAGRLLIQAKSLLPHGEWLRLFEEG